MPRGKCVRLELKKFRVDHGLAAEWTIVPIVPWDRRPVNSALVPCVIKMDENDALVIKCLLGTDGAHPTAWMN